MNETVAKTAAPSTFDVERVRAEFPTLHQQVNGNPLVYLDSAASAQRPRQVIEAVNHYYEFDHANVHRGVHTLSERATQAYEGAREKIRAYINAASTREIVYVRGTTEAINLVAQTYGRSTVKAGDEILISHMEHHSNIVPWQLLCGQTGSVLKVAPINQRGELDFDAMIGMMNERTKIVALGHISNALGSVNPVKSVISEAHARDIPVLIDGAQAMPHTRVDMQDLDADFYAFSGHKMFGPTGIGVLYAKEHLLDAMPPYQGGGEMILAVNFERSLYNELPYKFEAGTPNIAGAVGLGAAIDYLTALNFDAMHTHEQALLDYGHAQLAQLQGLKIIGQARNKASLISFTLDGVHPHDLGTIVDSEGVAIRTGHHCAMPVMEFFDVPATARASFAFYNTLDDIDRLVTSLRKAQRMLC